MPEGTKHIRYMQLHVLFCGLVQNIPLTLCVSTYNICEAPHLRVRVRSENQAGPHDGEKCCSPIIISTETTVFSTLNEWLALVSGEPFICSNTKVATLFSNRWSCFPIGDPTGTNIKLIKNHRLATLLLLQIAGSPDINASHSSSVEQDGSLRWNVQSRWNLLDQIWRFCTF